MCITSFWWQPRAENLNLYCPVPSTILAINTCERMPFDSNVRQVWVGWQFNIVSFVMRLIQNVVNVATHVKRTLLRHKQNCGETLTLTLPGPSAGVSGSLDNYCSLKPLCSGMGEVVPPRTSPTLLPPSPRTVLSLSCFKVSQCINCRDWHFKS